MIASLSYTLPEPTLLAFGRGIHSKGILKMTQKVYYLYVAVVTCSKMTDRLAELALPMTHAPKAGKPYHTTTSA